MRNLVLIVLGLMIIGCADKPNDLVFGAYEGENVKIYPNKVVQKLFIASVSDARENYKDVGYFEQNGNFYLVETQTSLRVWFFKALEDAFKARGYEIVDEEHKDALKLKLSIEKISAVYKQHTSSDNMFGTLLLKVSYAKYGKNEAKTLKLSQNALYPNLPNKDEYEAFIQTMLNKSVDEIAQKALNF